MLSHCPIECPVSLLDRASTIPALPTAVVNCCSPLVLQSARLALQYNLIEPVLIGNRADISLCSMKLGWDTSRLRIIAAKDADQAAAIAVALARQNEVSALMKGDLHTDILLRAVLNREKGLRTGRHLSHVCHLTLPDHDNALCITDAVINVQPSIAQKIDIARNAVELLHALGNPNPRIALLSGTEHPTPAMPSSIEAAEVKRHAAAGSIPGAIVDGPMGFDLAVSARAAALKGYSSPVSGHADVLLVPNLEAGNFLFKMMVHFMSAAAGGIVLGAKVPIMLTSRSDPTGARLAAAALAGIYFAFANNSIEEGSR